MLLILVNIDNISDLKKKKKIIFARLEPIYYFFFNLQIIAAERYHPVFVYLWGLVKFQAHLAFISVLNFRLKRNLMNFLAVWKSAPHAVFTQKPF